MPMRRTRLRKPSAPPIEQYEVLAPKKQCYCARSAANTLRTIGQSCPRDVHFVGRSLKDGGHKMRLVAYIILMLCAVMLGLCSLLRINPFVLALCLGLAAYAGYVLAGGKE